MLCALDWLTGQLFHRGEQIAHVRLRNLARDEYDPAVTILPGPGFQFHRWMGEMLNILHHHRATAAGDVEDALHPQQVGTAQRDQRLHGAGERAPLDRPGLDWRVCYQSRVGPLKWLGPSVEEELHRAGRERVPVVVAPISFVSEHSETLVELDRDYRRIAESCGVPRYDRAPTVGTNHNFIAALADLVGDSDVEAQRLAAATAAWLKSIPTTDPNRLR